MEVEAVAATTSNASNDAAVDAVVFAALPEAVLINVASFLPTIPRGLFAIAMTPGQSSAWRDAANWNLSLSLPSQIILSSRDGAGGGAASSWDVLDFREIDHHLKWKLTEDDVGALIAAVDGKNKLKKLFLHPHFRNFKGYALQPLHGSTTMVQIDIDNGGIEEDIALPILESFIQERQSSSLRHISLPEHWRKRKQSSNLRSFLRRYDDLLYGLRFQCRQCGNRVGRSRHGEFRIECIGYGMQHITCYKCLNNFCTRCKTYDGEDVDPSFCNSCDRYYCCVPIEVCGICNKSFCENCDLHIKCEGWDCENPHVCDDCRSDYDTFFQCTYCKQHLCKKCSNSSECQGEECEKVCCDDCYCEFGVTDDVPTTCKECGEYFATLCNGCRWSEYKSQGYVECEGCRSLLFPSLEEENARLRKEIAELKGERSSMAMQE